MIMREEKYEDEAILLDSSLKKNFGRTTNNEAVKSERITDKLPQNLTTPAYKISDAAADDADNYRRTRGRARIF